MSEKTAKTIVLLTGAFLFAAIGIKRSTIPDPYRYAWGAGLITLGLSVVADIAPEVAGPAALLVLFAVYMRNRGVVGGCSPASEPLEQRLNLTASGQVQFRLPYLLLGV